ncbi:MAG: hypothetical protein V1656_03160 [Candidatus Jorgensenbacteria bacterium]
MKQKQVLVKIALFAASFAVVGYGAYAALSPAPLSFPPTFLWVWRDAAQVSGEVVRFTDDTNRSIGAVNMSDLLGDTARAQNLIHEARGSNQLAYGKAVELTQTLQRLAASLRDIPSVASQRVAYEALAVELSLVSEFIVYTENLNRFLDRVAQALVTDAPADRQAVDESLREVNGRAERINALNAEFTKKMEQFNVGTEG